MVGVTAPSSNLGWIIFRMARINLHQPPAAWHLHSRHTSCIRLMARECLERAGRKADRYVSWRLAHPRPEMPGRDHSGLAKGPCSFWRLARRFQEVSWKAEGVLVRQAHQSQWLGFLHSGHCRQPVLQLAAMGQHSRERRMHDKVCNALAHEETIPLAVPVRRARSTHPRFARWTFVW